MKYMTFPSSCAFAGVANLLAFAGVDASDREIALEMGLPYLFGKSEQGGYLSGPMMQTGELFDLFLRPRGFRLAEQRAEPSAVPCLLARHAPAMVGLRLDADRKHAVIYTGRDGDGRCRFLNNKWEDAPESDRFLFTEEELLARLDAPATVGWLETAPCAPVSLLPYLTGSIQAFQEMRGELLAFCGTAHTWAELWQARDPLFRPLLLDGVSMANLLGESALEESLRTLQGALLAALRRGRRWRQVSCCRFPSWRRPWRFIFDCWWKSGRRCVGAHEGRLSNQNETEVAYERMHLSCCGLPAGNLGAVSGLSAGNQSRRRHNRGRRRRG